MVMAFREVVPVSLFNNEPWRWRVATRNASKQGWLQFDMEDLHADLMEKAWVLSEHADDAVVSLPGSQGPAGEVLALVNQALADHNLPLVDDGPEPPLERAALRIHEDLMLMERKDDEWVMTAGAVCFPTGWSPAANLGRSLAGIHAVVPRFDDIALAVDRLFARLRPGSIVWRPNWSVVDTATLRLPAGQRRMDPQTTTVDDLHLRIERQTLRRLVEHPDAMVFTVRVHRWPLWSVLPELDLGLLQTLQTMPDDVANYKNLLAWRETLVEYVEQALGNEK